MHPILASGVRFRLYLLVWSQILLLLALVIWAVGRGPWLAAIAVLAPACAVYAFICLSPWYICLSRPLTVSSAPALAVTHLAAAAAGGLILTGFTVATALMASLPAPNWVLLFAMGVLLYLVSVGLHYAALAAEASHRAERRAAEVTAMAREAELLSLRIQLNPHFLFNSLHSISALATLDDARAREMCLRLADFLRSSMGLGDRESIPLGEELALVRSYLDVERVRFGERLRVEEEIDPAAAHCAVPALLLQPLVENAVKHGIAGLTEGGSIRLVVRRTDEGLAVAIENGVDMNAPERRSLGAGHAHIRRRLEVRYGGTASFVAHADEGVYRVLLRLPCESPMTSSRRA